MTSPYRPSPLSFNSPRPSPFRRPSSPGSPSTVIGRPSTPPGKTGPSPMTSPSKLKQSFTADDEDDEPVQRPITARSQTEPPPSPTTRGFEMLSRRTDGGSSITAFARNTSNQLSTAAQSDNLSKLPPQLLHSMREAFAVLDHNSTGLVTSSSVVETLTSLGLQDSINPSAFFPPGQSQQLSLPQFLNQLANILVALSPQQELLNAFSAFDDDDSGQIDVVELREALLTTVPEPGEQRLTAKDVDRALEGYTGRRVFGRNAIGIAGVKGLNKSNAGASRKNGDVFRYQEFVGNLSGGPSSDAENVLVQTVQAR